MPGQQALAHQRRVPVGETGEVVDVVFGNVIADELYPGPADGRVIFLWNPGIPCCPLNAVADQPDGCGHAETADCQPGQVDVLTVAESS
ncbi:MAG TPA: hypothetical protein VF834_21420 [Streptosporangiaceae bacterium]